MTENKAIEQKLEKDIYAVLEEDIAHMDAATLSKLRQARESALDIARHKQEKNAYFFKRVALPITATALLVAVLTFTLIKQQPAHELPVADIDAFGDLDLLAHEDDIELYADLDFLLWLESQNYAS